MPISMTANKSTGESAEGRFFADPGTYVFQLREIVIDEGSDFDDKSIKFPQARIVWEDADGDRFSDSFVRIPKGFQLNDKAKWTNRLSALVGRPLTDDDAPLLTLDLGEDIGNYDDLCDAVAQKLDNGRPAFLKVLALEFDGQSLFGRQVQLTLGVKGDYMRCAANGAAPMPNAAGKKKKATAPAEAETDPNAMP